MLISKRLHRHRQDCVREEAAAGRPAHFNASWHCPICLHIFISTPKRLHRHRQDCVREEAAAGRPTHFNASWHCPKCLHIFISIPKRLHRHRQDRVREEAAAGRPAHFYASWHCPICLHIFKSTPKRFHRHRQDRVREEAAAGWPAPPHDLHVHDLQCADQCDHDSGAFWVWDRKAARRLCRFSNKTSTYMFCPFATFASRIAVKKAQAPLPCLRERALVCWCYHSD